MIKAAPMLLGLLGLLGAPALAQDTDKPWQVGLGLTFQSSATKSPGGGSLAVDGSLKRAQRLVPSLHAGYRFHSFAHSDLTFTGEYQFRSSQDVNGTLTTVQGRTVSGRPVAGTFQSYYHAPGIQWNFHQVVDYGFGLQYRFTQLRGGGAGLEASTRYDRPWLVGYVGHTASGGERLKPYVALRVAMSPVSQRTPSYADVLAGRGGQERLLKSMAGNTEISVQAGVRF
jgi:hypothetical protein